MSDTPEQETSDRDGRIVVRATREQRAEIEEAARDAGLTVSAWLRSLALREARAAKTQARKR